LSLLSQQADPVAHHSVTHHRGSTLVSSQSADRPCSTSQRHTSSWLNSCLFSVTRLTL